MTITTELRQAIEQAGNEPIRIEDPDTHRRTIVMSTISHVAASPSSSVIDLHHNIGWMVVRKTLASDCAPILGRVSDYKNAPNASWFESRVNNQDLYLLPPGGQRKRRRPHLFR